MDVAVPRGVATGSKSAQRWRAARRIPVAERYRVPQCRSVGQRGGGRSEMQPPPTRATGRSMPARPSAYSRASPYSRSASANASTRLASSAARRAHEEASADAPTETAADQWWVSSPRWFTTLPADRSSIASAVRRCRLTRSDRGRPARMEARTTPLSNSTRPLGADTQRKPARAASSIASRSSADQSPGLVRQQLFAPCHPGSPRPRAVAWPAAKAPRRRLTRSSRLLGSGGA